MHCVHSYIQLLVAAYLLTSASAANRKYELKVTNEFIHPDGFNRRFVPAGTKLIVYSVLANRIFPAPLITASKNDRLQVKVINRLTDTSMAQGTSIHWHGIFQHKTASQDGVSWVTQCPISPGEEFQYDFNVGEQAGTFWYHSHITTQYCDGLRGPLIIYDKHDPHGWLYDIDDENTVITLGDWLHKPSPLGRQTLENPESTVINGLGRFPNGPKSPLAVVGVRSGRRYRFRVINTACISSFTFSIDHHKLTVIEADGIETHPVTVDTFEVFPGQRISAVVHATQREDNYWIRAVPNFFGINTDNNNKTGINAAIFRYQGARNIEPTTSQIGTEILREQDLTPLVSQNLGFQKPDISLVLNIRLDLEKDVFLINDNQYIPPPIPVLLQIMNGSVDPLSIMPNNSVITLPRNKLISVTVPGGSDVAPHPFHLHGHTFEVIRSAGSNVTNLRNPPIRDVVNTGLSGDNVTILFRTDNPGPWFFHCHIDFHLEAGLAIVFAEDPKGQVSGPNAIETPKDWKDLCPKWNSLKSGKQFSINDFE
ncbi:laccase [Collybia nuda]|uniref:Laccase n=1 Tax=Collybia nuda TaxID=64659 RepID=A0A9P5XYA1_9AGAR|nr:laccase [Collybia nuda]